MLDNILKGLHIWNNINNTSSFFFWFLNRLKTSNFISEILTCHASVLRWLVLSLSDDTCVLWDRDSCVNIVSSAHNYSDSSSVASLDWFVNSVSEWILKTENTYSSQIFFKAKSVLWVFKLVVLIFQLIELIHGHISVAHQNGSVSLLSHIFNSSLVNV